MSSTEIPASGRTRVPAAERRDALISAAVHEFAQGGLHGTPVGRIAMRVGVAQPYVFSLFATKRDLFLAAMERSFGMVAALFQQTAVDYDAGRVEAPDVLSAMGLAYRELLRSDRDWLMLQHQAFAACNDEVVRERVRACYAGVVELVRRRSGASDERIDEFLRYGTWLNVAAAVGIEDFSAGGTWVCEALGTRREPGGTPEGDAASDVTVVASVPPK